MNMPPTKRPWPATQIEMRKVVDLVPTEKNARTHSKAQVLQISRSIERFGFTVPILIGDKNEVIAGHGRLEAAKLLKIDDVPVMVAKGWSANERRAYLLIDNQLGLNSEWDVQLLGIELADLKTDFSLEGLGFSPGVMADLLPKSPEAAPANRKAPQSVIAFNMIFDDAPQQEAWFAFMRKLKVKYPKIETFGARLAEYLKGLGDGPL